MADEIIVNETETEVESQTEGTEMQFDDPDDSEWDAVTWGEDTGDDDGESTEAVEKASDAGAEADQQTPEAEQGQSKDGAQDTGAETEDYLELKHMDETKRVTKEEAKTLAQKGLDYDRIRGERDTMQQDYQKLKGYESFLNELKGEFPSIESLIEDTRARMLADKENISYADAVAKVKLMHPVSAESAPKADQPKGNDAVQKFVELYPDVKADQIPESVWAETRKTGDLVSAYAKYEKSQLADKIASLEKEINTLKQNSRNAARSPGSSNSSGKTSTKSLIEQLWEEDD